MTNRLMVALALVVSPLAWASSFEVTEVITDEGGAPGNDVRAVHVSRDGATWVGTRNNGVGRLDDGTWTAFTTKDGLISDGVLAIHESDDGALWFAGGGGAQSFANGTWSVYPIKDAMQLDGRAVFSISRGASEEIWFGTTAGAARLEAGKWTSITTDDGLAHPVVHDVLVDGQGRVWFATRRGGLNVLTDGSWEAHLADANSRSLFLDSKGSLWVGTGGQGVVRQVEGDWETHHEGLTVLPLIEDSQGRIWFGSEGSGLFVRTREEWSQFTTKDGLPSDVVFSAAERDDGTFWVGTDAGLARVRLD